MPPSNSAIPLDQVGPDDRLQAPVDRVATGQKADQPDAQERVDPEDGLEREGSRIEHRRQRHEDVRRHDEARHQGAGADIVAEFQVLGDRVDARLQEAGQEEESDQHEGDGGHPFVAGDGEAEVVSLARHADEVLGRDVGRDQRETDQPPRQVAPGQEVVACVVLSAGGVQRDAHHEEQEADEGGDVEGLKGHCGRDSIEERAARARRPGGGGWVEGLEE